MYRCLFSSSMLELLVLNIKYLFQLTHRSVMMTSNGRPDAGNRIAESPHSLYFGLPC